MSTIDLTPDESFEVRVAIMSRMRLMQEWEVDLDKSRVFRDGSQQIRLTLEAAYEKLFRVVQS
jgi:hypothetical protein